MTAHEPIRILVADDHPSVRRGLAALIAGEGDMACIGQAADTEAMLGLARAHPADVLVCDMRMPGPPIMGAIEALLTEAPRLKVMMLTTFIAEDSIMRAMRAGVRAYLSKTADDEELLGAIRAVHAGRRVVPPAVADSLAEAAMRPQLTARELEVLAELPRARNTKAIARSLGIRPGTVRSHMEHIFEKLGCSDRTAALVIAQKRGLLDLEN